MVQLQEIESQLIELGYQILALSPDEPSAASRTETEKEIHYRLLSDAGLTAARAFGVGFQAPNRKPLPVPAVFVMDTEGRVQFMYANPNYRVRLDPDVLVAAARAARKP